MIAAGHGRSCVCLARGSTVVHTAALQTALGVSLVHDLPRNIPLRHSLVNNQVLVSKLYASRCTQPISFIISNYIIGVVYARR